MLTVTDTQVGDLKDESFRNARSTHDEYKPCLKVSVKQQAAAKQQHANTIFVQEEFEDTKGVIIMRKSKKNRQHNG